MIFLQNVDESVAPGRVRVKARISCEPVNFLNLVNLVNLANGTAPISALRPRGSTGRNGIIRPIVATDFSAFPGREPGFRAEALARLFEAVHEGIYSGLVSRTRTVTLAANPHLKLMLGFAPETPEDRRAAVRSQPVR